MKMELKDILYVLAIVVSAVVSFLTTRHKMKEYIRDKTDLLKDEINELKLKHQELRSKDDLQQLVLDQIGKQIDELLPKLVEAVNSKKTR